MVRFFRRAVLPDEAKWGATVKRSAGRALQPTRPALRLTVALRSILMNMQSENATEQFIQLITASQSRLYAYILSLLPDPERANDVLQETNLVLWRKSSEFTPDMKFMGWACRIAHFQVLAALRDLGRDRLRFDDELVGNLAQENVPNEGTADERQLALDHCMSKLFDNHRKLIQHRYSEGGSVKALAEKLNRPVGSVSQALYRIRQALLECVEKKLGLEA
jgi:RNA polymerase sigma-70 factor (ECF subfamily)